MPSLRELRCEFTRQLATLILWIREQGYEVALGEGYVALTDAADGDYDGPHRQHGGHYTGLAMDLLLYKGGTYISNGDHPAWRAIGSKWETMHPHARWGGRFGDANHVSFEFGGVK